MTIDSSNRIFLVFSFFHLFFKLLLHNVLLNLSCYCKGKLSNKLYVLGDFVMSDISFAVIQYLMAGNLVVLKTFHFNYCSYLLSEFLIRNSNHLNILNSVHFENKVLNLFRINVLPSSYDHILFPTNN